MVYNQEIHHIVVANDIMNGMETVWLIPSLSKKNMFYNMYVIKSMKRLNC